MERNDQQKRLELIRKLKLQALPAAGRPRPIVSLEDFFIGNHDYGSIGCNLLNHPGPEAFFERLKEIRSRPQVQDVLVEICELEEAHEEM